MRTACLCAAIFVVVSFGALERSHGTQEIGPRSAVEQLHATLLETMKEAHRLGFQGRYERIEPVVRANFDLPTVARIAVGKHWRDFDDTQRQELVETFSRLSVATYAGRFESYSGEAFRLLSEKDLERGRKLVRSVLVKADGDQVHLDYVLHAPEGRWQIINVVADGVSDLSLKRAEYTATIEKEGFGGLLAALKGKIEELSGGGSE